MKIHIFCHAVHMASIGLCRIIGDNRTFFGILQNRFECHRSKSSIILKGVDIVLFSLLPNKTFG